MGFNPAQGAAMKMVLGAVLMGCVVMSGCSDSASRAAAVACEGLLLRIAKNPSSAKIPSPSASVKSDKGWMIAWEHGRGLAFQNGYGAMIDSTAECATSPDGKYIYSLTVDGDYVFQSPESLAEAAARAKATQKARVPLERAARAAADAAAEAAAAAASID